MFYEDEITKEISMGDVIVIYCSHYFNDNVFHGRRIDTYPVYVLDTTDCGMGIL